MVHRKFWLQKIEELWKERAILWLSGVRRSGKTCICESLDKIEYFDCELPRVRRTMEDPQAFLDSLRGKRIVLDEIHRLHNPSEILKIAADHYSDIRILAAGSSTLAASSKFKDTLTGRKLELLLTPMIHSDLRDFKQENLQHRFLRGGLPPFFLAKKIPERDFQEWMDSYWAKDVQELFRLERRYSFLKFTELIMINSGGIFEATKYSSPCEVSRPTITNYLKVLEATHVINIIRPFSSHLSSEIISAPKVYAFDTGFVCYHRGWHELRSEDNGCLWEHFILNELIGRFQTKQIFYWRDKRGHEIDFIIAPRGSNPIAIECKWSSADFNPKNIRAFHKRYLKGKFLVAANDVTQSFVHAFGEISVKFVNLQDLITELSLYLQ